MAKSFEKRVVYSILGLVILSIGWLTAVPSTIRAEAEMTTTPTVYESRHTAVHDNQTPTTPRDVTPTNTDTVRPRDVTSTNTVTPPSVTHTNTATPRDMTQTIDSTMVNATVLNGSSITERRDPWVTSPRIGGGNGVSVRDVGGYVYLNISPPRLQSFLCNGALIDPEWVMINAGCLTVVGTPKVMSITPNMIEAVVGCYGKFDTCKNKDALWYGTRATGVRVTQIVVAPKTSEYPAMTVALLKLASPVVTGNGVNILPIGTAQETVIGVNGLQVLSQGYVANLAEAPKLQRATYQIVNDSSCRDTPGLDGVKHYRDELHHCGAPTPPTCSADWGAPIIRTVNGQEVLYGILAPQSVVHGVSCPRPAAAKHSVSIDVTSATIRQWIATTVRQGRTGIVSNQNGSGGLGNALARGNNRQHVIDIGGVFPQGIRIGGVTSKKLSINENGVIALGSMTSGIPSYIDIAKWSGGKAPIIVVFGADGDTSGTAQRAAIGGTSSGSNQVWVTQDVSRRVVVITWDDIRPFSLPLFKDSSTRTGPRYIGNNYQVELRAQENGDVKVTMRYGVIGWTAGATQCGANCNGKYGQVGIADGRGKFQLGVPVVATSDVGLRKLTGKQLTFYLRDGVINRVNQVPPVRPTWTASPTRTLTSTITPSMTITLTSSPTSTPIGQGLTDGLLAWYPLNGIRTTGSTLPVQISGILGETQYFDGTNDFHKTSINIANTSFTIAKWALYHTKTPSTLVNPSLSIGDTLDPYSTLVMGVMWDQKHYDCLSVYGPSTSYIFPATFKSDEWHHYACVYDLPNRTMTLYVDGLAVNQTTNVEPMRSTSSFYIGRYITEYFKGMMRDLMVYNTAFDQSNIQKLMQMTQNHVMNTLPYPASDCRWVDEGGMVHEYEINHDLLTWDQAKTAAESRSRGGQKGYLATITSAAENDCLVQLITLDNGWLPSTDGPYIGGKRVGADGLFRWEVGPEQGMVFSKHLGYVNWYGSSYNANDFNPDPRLEFNVMRILRSDAQKWNNEQSSWLGKSIIEYTYPESHSISGVAYTDVNANKQLDNTDVRISNQLITLTADVALPIDIVGGGHQLCARLDDGQVVCWGRRGDTWRWDQQSAVPIEIESWRDALEVSHGVLTSCARFAGGTVSCMGQNTHGSVGNGTSTNQWTPVPVVGLANVRALHSGGGNHHCAVLHDQTVRCWGDNRYGQIGDNSTIRRNQPVAVSGLTNVKEVSVGERHTCALKHDGSVWCWGANDVGQLASSTIIVSRVPMQISGLSGSTIRAGTQHTCLLRSDTQVACWGHPGGINGNRTGALVTNPTVVANTTQSVSLGVGNEQSCVAKSNGTVWCWGHVFHGESGWVASGTTTNRRSSAVQMPSLTDITQIALTANSGCGRRANGDVLCWGESNMGQLGDGTYQPRGIASYIRVTWQTNPYAARVAMLDSGWTQRCAILTDRRVACWGSKHPWWSTTTDTTLEAGIVPGLRDVVDLYVAPGMACALQRRGSVWCWGDKMVTSQFVNGVASSDIPQRHVLGDVIDINDGGSSVIYCLTRANTSPVVANCYSGYSSPLDAFQLPSGGTVSDIGEVASGHLSSCVLNQSNGNVWCWGDNTYYGQLGIGSTSVQTSVPQQIVSLSTIQSIDATSYSACALLADSSVKCWGQAIKIDGVNGGAHQTGGTSAYATPIAIPNSSNTRQIATGMMNCAVKYDDTVWCWGVPKWESTGSITPWQIIGVTDAVAVDVSADNNASVCILRKNGIVQCWGYGGYGMLGDGTREYRSVYLPINEPWQANVNRGCEWVDAQGRRHFYESLSVRISWSNAQSLAQSRQWNGNNGYLATLTSPEESRCISQLFMRQEDRNNGADMDWLWGQWYPARWVGGSDSAQHGVWRWMNGPEAGEDFFSTNHTGFNNWHPNHCCPASNPADWDYIRLSYPLGTYDYRDTWIPMPAGLPLGALIEYNSAGSDIPHTYSATTDNQGLYRFEGLAPGVYILQVNGSTVRERIVINRNQLDVDRNVRSDMSRATLPNRLIGTSTPTHTVTVRTITQVPTMTPTATPKP